MAIKSAKNRPPTMKTRIKPGATHKYSKKDIAPQELC